VESPCEFCNEPSGSGSLRQASCRSMYQLLALYARNGSIFLTSFYMDIMNLGDIVVLSRETINRDSLNIINI
jgi:hypothetical protein